MITQKFMTRTLLGLALLGSFVAAQAQDKLPREEALKYAFAVSANLKEMLKTPIPTDPDVKRPVAVRDGDYGGMVLPETKLSVDTFAKAGKEAVPVGQLWMHKLVPISGGDAVPEGKLRIVHVSGGDNEADVPCCALAIHKNDDGALELLIYGKGNEPVAKAPVTTISGQQDGPVEISAERKDDGGEVTLKFFGKYQTTFKVTDPNA